MLLPVEKLLEIYMKDIQHLKIVLLHHGQVGLLVKIKEKPSKDCGPGLSFRSRKIKYTNSNEGKPCPELGQQKSCLVNNRECVNPNVNQINK